MKDNSNITAMVSGDNHPMIKQMQTDSQAFNRQPSAAFQQKLRQQLSQSEVLPTPSAGQSIKQYWLIAASVLVVCVGLSWQLMVDDKQPIQTTVSVDNPATLHVQDGIALSDVAITQPIIESQQLSQEYAAILADFNRVKQQIAQL